MNPTSRKPPGYSLLAKIEKRGKKFLFPFLAVFGGLIFLLSFLFLLFSSVNFLIYFILTEICHPHLLSLRSQGAKSSLTLNVMDA